MTTIMDKVSVRLDKADRKRLATLTAATGLTPSEVLRACLRQSGGAVRKQHLKDFVKRVQEMPDPFEPSTGYDAHQAAAMIDDTDRQIADIPPTAPHTTDENKQLAIAADKRIERILWLIDSPDSDIPADLLASVMYWRHHYGEAMALLHAKQA